MAAESTYSSTHITAVERYRCTAAVCTSKCRVLELRVCSTFFCRSYNCNLFVVVVVLVVVVRGLSSRRYTHGPLSHGYLTWALCLGEAGAEDDMPIQPRSKEKVEKVMQHMADGGSTLDKVYEGAEYIPAYPPLSFRTLLLCWLCLSPTPSPLSAASTQHTHPTQAG